jgi:hypothetical protein
LSLQSGDGSTSPKGSCEDFKTKGNTSQGGTEVKGQLPPSLSFLSLSPQIVFSLRTLRVSSLLSLAENILLTEIVDMEQ